MYMNMPNYMVSVENVASEALVSGSMLKWAPKEQINVLLLSLVSSSLNLVYVAHIF